MVYMFFAYFCVKGFLYQVVQVGLLPFFQDALGTSGSTYQVANVITFLPWAMKSLFAAISDTFPILGYHKRYYAVIASGLGSLAFALVAFLPVNQSWASAALPFAFLFFLAMCEPVVIDLLCEGTYARIMRDNPKSASDIITYVWILQGVAGIVAGCLVGPLADNVNSQVVFIICLPFALSVVIPALLGWMTEPKVDTSVNCCGTIRMDKVKKNPKLFILAVAMAVSALVTSMTSAFLDSIPNTIITIVIGAVDVVLAFYCLPLGMAKANTYLFMQMVLYVQIPGALQYFYTGSEVCMPGDQGPHFSFTYFITFVGIMQAVFQFLGTLVFQAVMRNWNFRHVLWSTILIYVVSSIFDIIMIMRWNLKAGISDDVMYLIGDAMINQVCYMMMFLPSSVLISKLCPDGVEATVYALLAGFSNYGQSVSMVIGDLLVNGFGLKTDCAAKIAADCDCNLGTDNDILAIVVAIGHFAMPLLCIPLTFILIPNLKMTDDFVLDERGRVLGTREQFMGKPEEEEEQDVKSVRDIV